MDLFDTDLYNNDDEGIENYSAFEKACKTGMEPKIKTLLKKGVDLEDLGKGLYVAIENGHMKAAELIMKHNKECIDEDVFSVICYYGKLDFVKTIVRLGVDIKQYESIALRRCVERDHIDMLKYFHSIGFDIHIMNDRLLAMASENRSRVIIEFLMHNGANIDAENGLALRWACSVSDNFPVIKMLVEKYGANIYVNDNEPMCLSALYGQIDVVKFLVSKNDTLIYSRDYYPIRMAALYGHVDLFKYLHDLDKTMLDDTMLYLPCSNDNAGCIEIIDIMLSNGINANNDMALTCAASIAIIEKLVAHGASLDTISLEDYDEDFHEYVSEKLGLDIQPDADTDFGTSLKEETVC